MSSKEQYKDALKRDKARIIELEQECEYQKKLCAVKTRQINDLKDDMRENIAIQTALYMELKKAKRWYQIFIKYPI
jgi:hypothetical protein